MSNWAQRAAASILPLSEAANLRSALGEWYYTGDFFDFETASEVCELCGQQDLRYHFEIQNKQNSNVLFVGSECIKRFDLAGIDESGRHIDASQTAKLVDRHRRVLVEDARQKRVMTALLKLGQKDNSFNANSFLEYVDGRGAFTPNQLAYVFWLFQKSNIDYRARDYKVTIKRGREKGQIREMKPAALRRIFPSLTSSQVSSIDKIKERFEWNMGEWRKDKIWDNCKSLADTK